MKSVGRFSQGFYLLFAVAVLLATLGLCEIIVRLLGEKPYVPVVFNIKVEPGGRFYQPHPSLGYQHLPGKFTLTLPDSYTFQVTHLKNTLRATHPEQPAAKLAGKPQMWIFGCSFTHGWGLNDSETFAWVLQEKYPDWEVVNLGVGGYATIHALVQLREALHQGMRPRLAILAYGSFHNTRNICSRLYRKAVIPHNRLGELTLPCGRLGGQGELIVLEQKWGYTPLPFMSYSALMHRLERLYLRYEGKFRQSQEVTKAIVGEIQQLCRQQGIGLLVATLTQDDRTQDLLSYCQARGIRTVDITVDLKLRENTNYPHDTHPSPKANREYAGKLAAGLREFFPLAQSGSEP